MPIIPVPGSEKFAHRPADADALRQRVGDRVPFHTVEPADVEAVDPLTYEVVRHRLSAIADEMGEAIKRMSGSVVVTDCNDFDSAILDEAGDEVQVGLFNMQLVASMDMAVKWTLDNRATNPGIHEGDMFLCNDPWVGGGLHQNDVSVFAPLFWEGKLFAWTCAVAHQVDLGGVSPGSWSVKSQDIFWESIPLPPVKIVEAGELRPDIEDVYLRRSRVPKLVALDLRAKIGANYLAHERLRALIQKYGATRVKAVMRRMLNDAEQRLRTKLRSLPDGTWRAVAHQDQAREGDRQTYKIVVAMSKRDDRLIFDFSGTDPQVEGLINCTFAGLRGGILPVVLPLLCGDIPWAPGGILRCLEIVSEPGTINNCTFPAGISKASVSSAWATMNAVNEVVSQMLQTRRELRDSVLSVCCGTWDLALFAGVDQRNAPFVTMLCDAMAGGLGARADQDGVDTGGLLCIPMGRVADVEMNEFQFPMLYLWRREEVDSGGPGRFRGGLGASSCFLLHDTPIKSMHLVVSAAGKAIPQASGISGGYPGNQQYDVLVRGSDVRAHFERGRIPGELNELRGATEVVQPELETDMGWEDVYYTHWQAGGGLGDPLLRDPELVARDLAERKISGRAAHDIYGVVLGDDGQADLSATERRRAELRQRRAGDAAAGASPGQAAVQGATPLDENTVLQDDLVRCAHCGADLGDRGGEYLARALWREQDPLAAGPNVRAEPSLFVDRQIVLRQAFCPSCQTVLLTEIVPADEPRLRTVEV
jgi:N-methylhydantoinase B